MARKVDAKGGNGDVIFDLEKGTAKKYLRNTSSKDKVQRFEKELNLLNEISTLDIPNIVKVQNVFISDERIQESYVEMKKYDGSLYDLFEITRGNVIFSLKLILPVIKALSQLSECSPAIYHRDIKPDNILYEKDGDIYSLFLTDFGTCFLKDGSERLTPEIMAIGPRMFIAPEYEVGRVEEVDEKGDIFSVGKVIWCMLNGVVDDFLPSNFWFVDEYNLQKRFPNNPDMVKANVIIASCLSTNPKDRCDYLSLISQIEGVIGEKRIHVENEMKQKITLYQEKRKMELIEIKEKNRLLVNTFSQCYVEALEILLSEYDDFELLKVLHKEYRNKSRDGIEYTTVNVENNSAHYLYSRTYDRIYISLNYNPAHGDNKYCNLTISYNISTPSISRTMHFRFAENNTMVCEINENIELLNVETMTKALNIIIMDYISY
ncbi:MAG: protein kinase [Roseburia sp.]